ADLTVSAPVFQVRAVSCSADGRQLAVASGSGRAVFADTSTWRVLWRATVGNAGASESIAFADDGQTLVIGGNDGKQLVYALSNGDLLATLRGDIPQWAVVSLLP